MTSVGNMPLLDDHQHTSPSHNNSPDASLKPRDDVPSALPGNIISFLEEPERARQASCSRKISSDASRKPICNLPATGGDMPFVDEPESASQASCSRNISPDASREPRCDLPSKSGGDVPFVDKPESASQASCSHNISPDASRKPSCDLPSTSGADVPFIDEPERASQASCSRNISPDASITPGCDVPLTLAGTNSTKNKVGKRKCKKNLQYIDYMSDQEDFSTIYGDIDDSDNWSESSLRSEDTDADATCKKGKKKKTKRKVMTKNNESTAQDATVGDFGEKEKKINERKERLQKKRKGEQYVTKKGVTVPAKKVLPNPCLGKKCGNDCGSLPEERRQSIFQHFWQLDSSRRRDWLVSTSQKTAVKRKRSDSDKRNYTFKYAINEGEGKRHVCLQFLAATLNVSDRTIYNIVKTASWGSAKEDMRGKCEPSNKTKQSTIDGVIRFIKKLPAVPSHYCRQDSAKVYLPEELKNIPNVYKIYKKEYLDQGCDVVSERIFRKVFEEKFNIGFHVPKKDKCLKCLQYQNTENDPVKLKEKKDHEIEKEESYARFKAHKNIYKDDPSTLCASFDLEKVLNTPYAQSMLLYYSRKLAVYNLCVYENGTRKVFCFFWDETNGKRGANEIATILHRYIKSVDARGNIKRLLLYCDCCPGQNRNRTILAMLHTTLQECENLQTLQINFLLTGHTYMPVDSAHAMIENALKKTTIHAPSQWFTVFSTARQDPSPFEVERLMFNEFHRWDSNGDKYFKGNLTGKISKVRIMTFKKDKPHSASYKTSMNAAAKSFEVDIQSKAKVALLPCYRSLLPISKAKYDDLKKLCTDKVIPSCFHQEFINIPRETNGKDVLPDSDVEDPDFNA